jgi:hypothetical protein
MHFDNLVKVNKREVVREMPQITKPTNTLCKHCQQGKKTKTRFTSKEFIDYCRNHGIKRQFSVVRTPQHNGVVERKNMTVQEMA